MNGVIERLKKNCNQTTCLQKTIDELENRLDYAFEENETLFRVKADKDEMDEALSQKANCSELNAKVDKETFNCVKCELSEAILDAHKRIKTLTDKLDRQMNEILACLRTKVDCETFETFARCIEDRIKLIASETQRWMNMKKKEVCPLTRAPYVQNQCCAVCNSPVVMRGEECGLPKMPALHTIAWNCQTNALTCRTGGQHTVTTASDRVVKRSKFIEHFAGAKDCEPPQPELEVSTSCLQSESQCE